MPAIPSPTTLPPGADALTGLPGRGSFLDRLRDLAARDRALAVLFLDLDDFKRINDGFGHETGDRLLLEVAARLCAAVRPGDVVARLGGDEFTILCEGVDDERVALEIAERVNASLRAPFEIAGQRRQVRASIGCRVLPAHSGADADALLRDADVAMYQAKGAGKDRVELFSQATRALLVRRLQLESDLREALAEGGLEVHFQPQVELSTGRVVSAEALAALAASRRGVRVAAGVRRRRRGDRPDRAARRVGARRVLPPPRAVARPRAWPSRSPSTSPRTSSATRSWSTASAPRSSAGTSRPRRSASS